MADRMSQLVKCVDFTGKDEAAWLEVLEEATSARPRAPTRSRLMHRPNTTVKDIIMIIMVLSYVLPLTVGIMLD